MSDTRRILEPGVEKRHGFYCDYGEVGELKEMERYMLFLLFVFMFVH